MYKHKEALIIINKHELTESQSLTIRVSLEVFLSDLLENGLGEDQHGLSMTQAYIDNINSIRKIIFRNPND